MWLLKGQESERGLDDHHALCARSRPPAIGLRAPGYRFSSGQVVSRLCEQSRSKDENDGRPRAGMSEAVRTSTKVGQDLIDW